MNSIIDSVIITLQKCNVLLDELSNQKLSNNSVPPYYSSIGSHIRHILDFYDCILNKKKNVVDLTGRRRDITMETNCDSAKSYLREILVKLNEFEFEVNDQIIVIDDLGMGSIEINYTYSSLLAQANSHTIHHYAIINYILNGLNIKIEDDSFGYNPTTPKQVLAE